MTVSITILNRSMECHYVCRIFSFMLSVIMTNVTVLTVIQDECRIFIVMLRVVIQNVMMLNAIMLIVMALSKVSPKLIQFQSFW